MIKGNILYEPFSNWRFNMGKAEGSYIFDSEGKKYLDFTSGWNVCNLGWNNKEIAEAVSKQALTNTYTPMWASDDIRNKYAELLTSVLPKELCVIGRATGGTEANEEALKTVKAYTGRNKILCFKNTYHGQSRSTQILGFGGDNNDPVYKETIQIDFPTDNLPDFEKTLEDILSKKDIAGIILEAGIVTGFGQPRIAPNGFLTLVRKLTSKYGTLMILDEVGTGFSRCGNLFGMQDENVVPDIVTFAKAQTNGAGVLGTMVTTKEIAEKTLDKTSLISTFGWTSLACASAYATLSIHIRDKVWEKAKKDGEYILQRLQTELSGCNIVDHITGKGMLIGIYLKTSTEPLGNKIVDTA